MEKALAGVTPYAAAQAISYRIPSYLEGDSGAVDSFPLGYAGVTSPPPAADLAYGPTTRWRWVTRSLRGRAAWAQPRALARRHF